MKLPPDTCPVYNHIDLNRSLKLPHGSLTPGCQPEPRWRIEARRDAVETARVAILATACAIAFTTLTLLAVALGWL
jgi:hypothetical protein